MDKNTALALNMVHGLIAVITVILGFVGMQVRKDELARLQYASVVDIGNTRNPSDRSWKELKYNDKIKEAESAIGTCKLVMWTGFGAVAVFIVVYLSLIAAKPPLQKSTG